MIEGFSDGTYRPGLEVQRGQMATYIVRAVDFAEAAGFWAPVSGA